MCNYNASHANNKPKLFYITASHAGSLWLNYRIFTRFKRPKNKYKPPAYINCLIGSQNPVKTILIKLNKYEITFEDHSAMSVGR